MHIKQKRATRLGLTGGRTTHISKKSYDFKNEKNVLMRVCLYAKKTPIYNFTFKFIVHFLSSLKLSQV